MMLWWVVPVTNHTPLEISCVGLGNVCGAVPPAGGVAVATVVGAARSPTLPSTVVR